MDYELRVKNIVQYLETIAPLVYQESYDNSGLIVGHAEAVVTGILLALDSTEAVIDEAIAKGCNLVVAHHPIVFKGLKKLNGNNYIERTVIKAIKNDIAIYAIHTNLDNVFGGVNFMISEKLDLQNVQILAPKNQNPEIGSGAIGNLRETMSAADFLSYLKTKMNLSVIRHTSIANAQISRVAVCGGAGGFLLNDSIKAQADVFITADYKYHEFFDADNQILICDIGHYESEVFTKELLLRFLSKKFANFAVKLAETNTNPISYYH
jgi:dinuclear metal center YbgI/SA1388 family protein